VEDEDHDLIIDVVTTNKTIAEESYSLPVMMDTTEEHGVGSHELVVKGDGKGK
jgi:hypothetical protein